MKYFCFLLTLVGFSFSASGSVSSKDHIVIAAHVVPPLIYIENDEFKGGNVEVARLLAKRMNKTVEFTACPFARCLAMTKAGKTDMMIAVNKTEEREAFFSYLTQPFRTEIIPVRFYLSKDSPLVIENYDDLKQLSIGVLTGATYFERFDKDFTLNKTQVTSHTQLIKMLLSKRLETFIGGELSFKNRVDKEVYENEMKMAPYIYNKTNGSYIVISKKSPLNEEVSQFSQALDELIANGDIHAVLDKLE